MPQDRGGVLPQTGLLRRDVESLGESMRPTLVPDSRFAEDDSRQAKDEERALRASEQMYRELVENASDVIYVIDLQGNFTSINRAAQRISGYTRAEALKMNIAHLVASEYLEAARQ